MIIQPFKLSTYILKKIVNFSWWWIWKYLIWRSNHEIFRYRPKYFSSDVPIHWFVSCSCHIHTLPRFREGFLASTKIRAWDASNCKGRLENMKILNRILVYSEPIQQKRTSINLQDINVVWFILTLYLWGNKPSGMEKFIRCYLRP